MRRSDVLAILPFLLGILLLDVSSMYRMSPTYDEGAHLEFGKSVLERRSAGPSTQKMPISLLNYLAVRWLGTLDVDVSARTSLLLSRLPSVLASLVLATLVFTWARRLYGLRGALLAATLYAFCPTVIAHSRLVTNDIYSACLMFASTMLFVDYLKAPTPARLMLCAAATGLAQVTKQTALLLFPIFAVLWAIDFARSASSRPEPGRIARVVVHGLIGALVILVVVNAAYLFRGTLISVQQYLTEYRGQPSEIRDDRALTSIASLASRLPNVPVPLPHPYVYALATGILYNATCGGHGPVYLLGELSKAGWWHYFVVAFALKTPLALLLFLGGAAALSRRWFRKNPLDESALLVAPVILFAFFSFASTAQLGIRYLLPVFPFLFVAVGKVAAHTPRRHAAAYHATLAVLVLWFALSSLSFHPHYLSYFNELIGDRKNMYRYLADSNVDWAQSDEYLARYLAAQGRGRVAVNPEAPVTGRVVVNVNALVGITAPRERYAWLRDRFEPVDHVAYAWLVYEIPGR